MTDEVKKIINDLRICNNNDSSQCRRCSRLKDDISCFMKLGFDAADLIEHLSTEQDVLVLEIEKLRKELAAAKSGWISVEDRLPEEHDSAFAKLYSTAKWGDAMFRKQSNRVIAAYRCSNGAYIVRDGNTCDGIWGVERDLCLIAPGRITHWQPLPEPPKECLQ